jgi:hypothetical protein
MKRRLPVLTGLLVLLLIVQSGCVAATEAPLQEPLQQPTLEPTVTASTSDGPPAVQVTVTETVPEGTPSPEGALPEVATTTPFVERPPSLVTPPDKPSLAFPAGQGIVAAAVADVSYGHVIGFIFPNGQQALKLAALTSPRLIDENLTVVGAVEIGQDSQQVESGFYQIAIDLESTDRRVRGRLLAGDGGQDVTFERTPLIRNPDRPDSPTFPAISPIISSHGICFVVGQAEVLGKQAQPAIAWFRYCSFTEAGTNEPLLSVRDNFPEQFGELSGRFDELIGGLTAQNLAPGVQIDFSQTISEIEGHSNLDECIKNNECEADIVGAPNAAFWSDYDAARAAAGGGNFTVTAGIVRVERVVQIPGQEDVPLGVYWVRDWFDGQENFLGSTLLGVTNEGQVIAGQTIPAAPAYFLDAENPRTVVSWISAWRLCRWCKWQSNCP